MSFPVSISQLQKRAGLIHAVGSYRVGKLLGIGGTSIVHQAVHSGTGQTVALKFLDGSAISSTQMATREISLLKRLSHPNLVQLHDVFHLEEEQLLVIAMDYLPGGDLFDWITSRDAKEDDEAARLFAKLASAVQYCHSQTVVHRDLKPENAMLDSSGAVRLVDFGLSQVMSAGQLMHTFCGSPIYTAPEVLRRTPYVGPEVDVWSLGVMLYTMVTGLFPWEGQTVQEQLKNAMVGKWTIEKSLSPSCLHLISRMLCVDPSARATMAEVLSHPWVTKVSPPSSPSTPRHKELNSSVIQHLKELGFQEREIKRKVLEQDRTSQEYEIYQIYLRNGLGDCKPSSTQFCEAKNNTSPLSSSLADVAAAPSSSQEKRNKRVSLRLPKILSIKASRKTHSLC